MRLASFPFSLAVVKSPCKGYLRHPSHAIPLAVEALLQSWYQYQYALSNTKAKEEPLEKGHDLPVANSPQTQPSVHRTSHQRWLTSQYARRPIRVVEKVFHIQNVNAYHSRFKTWIRRFNGVATKYLPNYLGWYRWLDGNVNALTPQARFLTTVGSS